MKNDPRVQLREISEAFPGGSLRETAFAIFAETEGRISLGELWAAVLTAKAAETEASLLDLAGRIDRAREGLRELESQFPALCQSHSRIRELADSVTAATSKDFSQHE